VIKATKVDGVYDKDPNKYSDAVRYERLSYQQVITDNLGVMDMTAFAMCREHNMPILVVNFWSPTDLLDAVCGLTAVGTLIDAGQG